MHNSCSPCDNLVHMVDVLPCQGGKRMGQPSFSPPPKKQRLHVYSWQGKVGCVFRRRLTICTSLPPTDNLLNKACLTLSGWGKNGPAQFFPTPCKGYNLGCVFPQTIYHMHNSITPPAEQGCFKPCQGGERMGWPSFSPPTKKQRLRVFVTG